MPLRAVVALVALLCPLLWVAPGLAGDAAFSLHIAAECGSAEAFTARVAALLGVPADRLEWPAGRLALAPLDTGGYHLELALPERTRELDDVACSGLFSAAVVMVAASFEGRAQEQVGPPASTQRAALLGVPARRGGAASSVLSKPALPKQAVRGRSEPPLREREAASRLVVEDDAALGNRSTARPRAALAAGGGLVLGVLPAVHAQMELAALVALGRIDGTLTVRYLAPRDLSVLEGQVSIQGAGATLTASYGLASWLDVGVGVDLQALHGRAHGFAGGQDDWAWTAGARMEGWATMLRSRELALALGLAGLYQPVPAVFASSRGDALLSASSWGFQAGMRGAWEFF